MKALPTPFEAAVSQVDSNAQEEFFQSFLVTLLWSTTGDEDENLDDKHDLDDIHPHTLAGLRKVCDEFLASNHEDVQAVIDEVDGYTMGTAGHDLALSCNGHGAGFFDILLDAADRLQKAAEELGPIDAYVGDDGFIYVMGMEPPLPSSKGPKF